MKPEILFGFSLIAGFLFSALFVLSSGKLHHHAAAAVHHLHRLHHIRLPHWKMPGKKLLAKAHDAASPFAGPVYLGMFLTLFGFVGLVSRILLQLSPVVSIVSAFSGGMVAAGLLGSFFNRYFAATANEVKGSAWPGMIGRISLAIPEGGVGIVAGRNEGRRFTMPARHRNGLALSKGTRVIVIDVQNHIALVDDV